MLMTELSLIRNNKTVDHKSKPEEWKMFNNIAELRKTEGYHYLYLRQGIILHFIIWLIINM